MSLFEQLFRKFMDGNCTEEEKQELFEMIASPGHDRDLQRLIDKVISETGEETAVRNEKADEILSLILHIRPAVKKRRVLAPVLRWAAAAVFLLAAGSIAWHYRAGRTVQPGTVALASQDIPPAVNGALLTLADGSIIPLDSLRQGVIANQGGAQVVLHKGTVTYNGGAAATATYNTLSTPKGRLFHLVLPDGSGVWLNAGSSLRYPTAFTGSRTVELKGEAYFEIKQDPRMPFTVRTGDHTEVRVLGTGFNINAYDNEAAIRTTLLHGSVEVSTSGPGNKLFRSILKPGQQATIAHSQPSGIRVEQADSSQVVAWKNGLFNFENVDIATVMRQLERWYDIEVVYENGVPDIIFGGKMERDLSLSHVIRMLEISKVHLRVEGKKLIVTR